LIAAVFAEANHFGLAWLELSTGQFSVTEADSLATLEAELTRLKPAELLVEESLVDSNTISNRPGLKRLPPWDFEADTAHRSLCAQFGTKDLSGFGCADLGTAICAAGALLNFVKNTQRTALPHLTSMTAEQRSDALLMDAATRRNLELDQSLVGRHEHTLAGVMDHCTTSMGSRLLRRWINRPLRDHKVLQQRYKAVAALHNGGYTALAELLNEIGDLERILSRVALGSARPRDLAHLRNGLQLLPDLKATLDANRSGLLSQLAIDMGDHTLTLQLLKRAIIAEPPMLIRDGGVIKEGYDEELDQLRALSTNADGFLTNLEQNERDRTGISTLKVGYNRVHGYFIEISKGQADKAPENYIRRQTLKGAERYITPELKSFEDQVLSARERSLAREKMLYEQLLTLHLDVLNELQLMAQAIATTDVLTNLAERAVTLEYTQPKLTDQPGIKIKGGRHSVVEQVIADPFIANDLDMHNKRRLLIITGPNMGGKSTYMRQTALIALLAHIGSFVPAELVEIGPVDRIFTRVGAADDLSGGRSTFMVEMTETANILHNATNHSLVLMDEIGRGTSTFDGLSLAWATAHYIGKHVGAFTLFATHYFELTSLADEIEATVNVHLDATEHAGQLIFMHTVKEGPANQSYGLQVAALAGVPREVITSAEKYLRILEAQSLNNDAVITTNETAPLFDLAPPTSPNDHLSNELAKLNPDNMTPKQALDTLYRLKKKA
ncbi:MAG: DNA mismatch repair protein MutS, partial [Gammaproteobacteria bacterium]|nr:DNA mismatch repair protein MutS [Gammaproteobacteria bacterium]